ncbi:MAG: glycosyltransferase [Pseudomonadota bacterium]
MTSRDSRGPPIRILCASSLLEHPLNQHISHGLQRAASRFNNLIDLKMMQPSFALAELVDTDQERHEADLVLYFGSSASGAAPIEAIGAAARRRGFPTAFWATDDPFEFDFANRADGYDFYLSNDRNAAANIVWRANTVSYLPLAGSYDIALRRVQPKPDSSATSNQFIFFCGTAYQSRRIFLSEFAARFQDKHGPSLLLAGADWEELGYKTIAAPHNASELANLYSQAGLVLYLHRSHNVGNARFRLASTTPGPRVFDAALSGAAQIAEFFSFEIEQFFDPVSEVPLVWSAMHAADLAMELFNEPSRLLKLRQAAQRRAVADHTWENRLARLIKVTLPDRFSEVKAILNKLTAERLTAPEHYVEH